MFDPARPTFVFPFWGKSRGSEVQVKGHGCQEAWRAAETMRDMDREADPTPMVLISGAGTWAEQVRGLKEAVLALERVMTPVPSPPIPPDVVMDALWDRDPDGMRRSEFLAFKGRSQWLIERADRHATVYECGRHGAARGEFGKDDLPAYPWNTYEFPSIESAKAAAREWVRGDS